MVIFAPAIPDSTRWFQVCPQHPVSPVVMDFLSLHSVYVNSDDYRFRQLSYPDVIPQLESAIRAVPASLANAIYEHSSLSNVLHLDGVCSGLSFRYSYCPSFGGVSFAS